MPSPLQRNTQEVGLYIIHFNHVGSTETRHRPYGNGVSITVFVFQHESCLLKHYGKDGRVVYLMMQSVFIAKSRMIG